MKFKSFVIEAKDGRQVPAEIGHLKVPERRDIDAVRQITISCVRLPRRQATDLAPVVFLAGGPGESAIHVASGRLLEAFEHVQEITDVILLDVRGVGHSHPKPEYVDVAPSEALFESRNSILEHLIAEAQATVAVSRETGFDLHGYHAIEMAHDLRDLRDALGVQALTLWGYSFGSHLAMAVTRYHRDVAGSLILCGVEGPNHTHKLPANVDTHLERLARLIAAAPTGTRVPDFIGLMNEVHERLDRERPQVTMTLTSGGQPARYQIGPFAAQYATWRAMTNRRAYRLVPFQYARAAEGDYELLAKSIEVQWRRRPRSPVFYLSDSASGATRERLDEIRAQAASCVLADAASFPFPMIASRPHLTDRPS